MTARIAESLRYSIYDGSAHAIMMGMGETFIMTFAVALGMSSLSLGLVAALPILSASLFQLLFYNFVNLRCPKRRFITVGATLQGLTCLAIVISPMVSQRFGALLILSLVVYHICGHTIAPAWNAWMGELVPEHTRGRYYGRRNSYRALFMLGSFVLAGIILDRTAEQGVFLGFIIIFTIAGAARLVSAYFIHRMKDSSTSIRMSRQFSLAQFFKRSLRNNFGRFVWCVGAFLFATNIASPFFTVYMLRSLHFSYMQLTIALSMTLIFQFFSFQNWGRIGDQFGNLKILKMTAIVASIIPLLWLTTDRFVFILAFQALAGITWAGFNLAAINYIFDAVQLRNISQCTSYYNFMSNIGTALGAIIGGIIATHTFAVIPHHGLVALWGHDPYLFLFVLSSGARMIIATLLITFLIEVRAVEPHSTWQAMRHFIGLSLTPEFGSRFVNIFIRRRR